MNTPRRGDLGTAPRALPQVARHPGGVADLSVWVTIFLLLAVTALAISAWVWNVLAGNGPLMPLDGNGGTFTPQTVAPAVEYQPEPAP